MTLKCVTFNLYKDGGTTKNFELNFGKMNVQHNFFFLQKTDQSTQPISDALLSASSNCPSFGICARIAYNYIAAPYASSYAASN